MPASFQGADVPALRAFAKELAEDSRLLTRIGFSLSTVLTGIRWHGEDSERFRRDWNRVHRRTLQTVAVELDTVAKLLALNADEQELASTGSGLGGRFLPMDGAQTPSETLAEKISGMDSKELDSYLKSAEFQEWVRQSQANADAAKSVLDGMADSGALKTAGTDGRPNGYGEFLQQYWAESAMREAGIDPNHWDPSKGVDHNREDIYKVYAFYAELYKNDPRMEWIGMANQVGPTFIAGFEDIAALHKAVAAGKDINDLTGVMDPARWAAMRGLLSLGKEDLAFYETTFLSMQKEIFTDIGSQHYAFEQGGLAEIERLQRAGLVTENMDEAWRRIDGVPAYTDPGDYHKLTPAHQQDLHDASYNIADREQNYVIADDYDQIRDRPSGVVFTESMTVLGKPSIEGAKAYYEQFPAADPYLDPRRFPPLGVDVHHGNISVREDRWALIDQDTLGAYADWLHTQDDPHSEMVKPMEERVESYRMVPKVVRDMVGAP